jgi:hypothetical protein
MTGKLFDQQIAFEQLHTKEQMFGDTLYGALDGLIFKGESFNDVLKEMLVGLGEAALKAALLNQGAFATGANGPSGIGGLFGSLLGVFGHAGGGTVSGRSPVIVGERGPEVFVPNTSGTIMRNGGANGGTVTVHILSDVSPDLTQKIRVTAADVAVKVVHEAGRQQARAQQRAA